ncbi:MAG: DUF1566 domain-containing protein [Dokdonella sp.]|nr:DUF1566 domain-containing protein [Dokdonella sp.]
MIVDRKLFSDSMLPALRRALVLALAVGASTCLGADAIGVLPDTGQTTCFAPDYSAVPCEEATTGDASALPRQDARFGRDALAALGQLPKVGGGEYGFDYTRICANGDAEGTGSCPNGPPLPADVEHPAPNDWACLRDNVTGLVWSLGNAIGTTWAEASSTAPGSFIHRANTSARCGLSAGWRLPVRREGYSLMSAGRQLPSVEPAYFPILSTTLTGKSFWTTDVDMTWYPEAWNHVVFFDWAGTGSYNCRDVIPGHPKCALPPPGSNGRWESSVLLVNGVWRSASPSISEPRWQVRADGLAVSDSATGLMWDRCTWGQTGTTCDGEGQLFRHWNDAMQVSGLANQMRHRGYYDWRVPNARELESLVETDTARPAIDVNVFPNTAQELYWTSTQKPVLPTVSNQAWCVGFREGIVGNCMKAVDANLTPNRSPVRLVRGGNPYGMVDAIAERLFLADFDDEAHP